MTVQSGSINSNVPELPKREEGGGDTDFYVMKLSQAYRHGHVWAVKFTEFAELLMDQLGGGAPLRPDTRTEALDILGRLKDATKQAMPIPPPLGYVPEKVLSAELRGRIGSFLSAQKTMPSAAPSVA